MDKLLIDITERLTEKVPALKYIDEDFGQLDYYSNHPPVKYPCALVDATEATWTNTLKREQTGLVQVVIRVADLKLSNTSGKAPQGQKDKAFAVFTILKDVYKALQGWTGSQHYAGLIRMSNKRIKRDDGVRIYEIRFTTQLKDSSAVARPATVNLNPTIQTA